MTGHANRPDRDWRDRVERGAYIFMSLVLYASAAMLGWVVVALRERIVADGGPAILALLAGAAVLIAGLATLIMWPDAIQRLGVQRLLVTFASVLALGLAIICLLDPQAMVTTSEGSRAPRSAAGAVVFGLVSGLIGIAGVAWLVWSVRHSRPKAGRRSERS